MNPEQSFSRDRPHCSQPRQGYRYSIDSILLACFCRPLALDTVLDLGAGSGIIGLILAHRYPGLRLTGLELQHELIVHARDNIAVNGLGQRFQVVEGDFRHIGHLLEPESFDLVVCNPPYGQLGHGRLNSDDQRAGARHELNGKLEDAVRSSCFAVKNRKRICFVFPSGRLVHLLQALAINRAMPSRLQPVYAYPGAQKSSLVLVEAVKNGRCQLQILPALFVHARKSGPYSEEVAAWINGETREIMNQQQNPPCLPEY